MACSNYTENIYIRTRPGLRAAKADAARREGKTASEFLRTELKNVLTRKGCCDQVQGAQQCPPEVGCHPPQRIDPEVVLLPSGLTRRTAADPDVAGVVSLFTGDIIAGPYATVGLVSAETRYSRRS
jgi:hypothetical protein